MKKSFFTAMVVLISVMLLSGCFVQEKEEKSNQLVSDNNEVVYLVQTAPANMLKQLKTKEIDGFIAWEPFPSVAVKDGDGKYLFKSPDTWQNHPCCVVAMDRNFSDAKTVEAFIWAHVKATRFINDQANQEKVVRYASEFTQRSPDEVKLALRNITYVEFPDEDEFQEFYNSLRQSKLLKKSVKDIGFPDSDKFFAEFLRDLVYIDVSENLSKNPDWLPSPVPNNIKLRLGYLNHDLHQLALYVAEKEGYYAKVGLIAGRNFETKFFPNGVAVMEAFRAKDIDMAYLGGAPATLKRINDNILIEVIAGANNEGSALVVRNDLNINSLAELTGKTVAVPGVGTVQYTLLDKAMKENGLRTKIK